MQLKIYILTGYLADVTNKIPTLNKRTRDEYKIIELWELQKLDTDIFNSYVNKLSTLELYFKIINL